MPGLGPVRDGQALRVPTTDQRKDLMARWRRPTTAEIGLFVLALGLPVLAALVAGGFQAFYGHWPTWLGITTTVLAMVGLVWLLFLQFRKQRAGTLYAIEALDQRMLSWHRTAEVESRDRHLDYRPLYRPLTFPPGNGPVDLTAELEELRRSFEYSRQTDDESTGMTVAPNMLWPAAMYLGFMTPFPPRTRLIEFAAAAKQHDLEPENHDHEPENHDLEPEHQDPKPEHQDFKLGSVVGKSSAFRETADCGCVVGVVEDAVDPTTGERQQPSSAGGCADGGIKFLSIEVTGMLDWPWPSLPGITPCCATRLSIRIIAPCDAHPDQRFCSIRFVSSRRTRMVGEQNVKARDTPVELPSDQAMPISAWLSKRLLEACLDKSHQVLVRARLPKVMGLSLGAHLREHASLCKRRLSTEDVWGNLLLVDHPHPAPPRLVRVHPCQPGLPSLDEVERE